MLCIDVAVKVEVVGSGVFVVKIGIEVGEAIKVVVKIPEDADVADTEARVVLGVLASVNFVVGVMVVVYVSIEVVLTLVVGIYAVGIELVVEGGIMLVGVELTPAVVDVDVIELVG